MSDLIDRSLEIWKLANSRDHNDPVFLEAIAALPPASDALEALVKARAASAVNQAVRIVLDEVGYEEADICPNCQAALAAIRAGGKP